ncbi:DUF6153 family protein [Streptomyces reniochalinae]
MLIVLLLGGLLGMHGLGSASPPGGGEHHRAMPTASHHKPTYSPKPEWACHGGVPAHHSAHADNPCAAAGAASAPAAPALAVSPLPLADLAAQPQPSVRYEPEGGRAPPSLSELQLLRI